MLFDLTESPDLLACVFLNAEGFAIFIREL